MGRRLLRFTMDNAGHFQERNPKLKEIKIFGHTLGLDRLSELPDSLLLHILSFLEMKDAVRTGILSKRWEKLWTHSAKIIFLFDYENDLFEDEKRRNFISFVDCTLAQCISPRITMFGLRVFGGAREFGIKEKVHKWLDFVLSKNLEHLMLQNFNLPVHLPDSFYRNSTLTKLEVQGIRLEMLEVVSWPSLKSLSIRQLFCDDDSLEKILSGCPVLEALSLGGCYYINHLNIASQKLRKLEIFDVDYFYSAENNVMKIYAPWLQELEIGGHLSIEIQLVDVRSLVKAKLTFEYPTDGRKNVDPPDVYVKLLESISHVKELTLGPLLIQVLSMIKLGSDPSLLFNCYHLMIHSPIRRHELPGLASVLQSSPHLQTVVLSIIEPGFVLYKDQVDEFRERSKGIFTVEKYLKEGNFSDLKTVEIVRSIYRNRSSKIQSSKKEFLEIEIAKYLLKNASLLEKFVISLPPVNSYSNSVGLSFKSIFAISSSNHLPWGFSLGRFQHCCSEYLSICTKELFPTHKDDNQRSEYEYRKIGFCYEFSP